MYQVWFADAALVSARLVGWASFDDAAGRGLDAVHIGSSQLRASSGNRRRHDGHGAESDCASSLARNHLRWRAPLAGPIAHLGTRNA